MSEGRKEGRWMGKTYVFGESLGPSFVAFLFETVAAADADLDCGG